LGPQGKEKTQPEEHAKGVGTRVPAPGRTKQLGVFVSSLALTEGGRTPACRLHKGCFWVVAEMARNLAGVKPAKPKQRKRIKFASRKGKVLTPLTREEICAADDE